MIEIGKRTALLPRLVWMLVIVLTMGGGIFYSSVWLFAGIAVAVALGLYRISMARWPDYSEKLRAGTRLLICALLAAAFALHYHREFRLADVTKIPASDRNEAQMNWELVEKAFKTGDHRALQGLIGRRVLVLVDASGSPWTGKALSVEERAESAEDANPLAGAEGERARQIAREIVESRERGSQVHCRVDFTRTQVRHHFMWPDAVFGANFEVLGTLTKAAISGHSVTIKPVAIQPVILQL